MSSNSLNKKRSSVIKANSAGRVNLTTSEPVMDRFDPKATQALRDPEVAAEQEHKSGYDAGYAQGLAQAQADIAQATDDANRRVRRALAALTDAVDSFDQRQTVALADVEDAIVVGALALARTILQRELISAEDPGGDALARALQLVPDRGEVVARLHPDDAATLNMQRIEGSGRQIVVVADPNVEIGGCVAEVGQMTIDAQLSTAVAQAAKAMSASRSIVPLDEPFDSPELLEARRLASEAALVVPVADPIVPVVVEAVVVEDVAAAPPADSLEVAPVPTPRKKRKPKAE